MSEEVGGGFRITIPSSQGFVDGMIYTKLMDFSAKECGKPNNVNYPQYDQEWVAHVAYIHVMCLLGLWLWVNET